MHHSLYQTELNRIHKETKRVRLNNKMAEDPDRLPGAESMAKEVVYKKYMLDEVKTKLHEMV